MAGTKSLSDVVSDLRLPFDRGESTQRFALASRLIRAGRVSRVVGHSLGGAIAHRLHEKYGVDSTTYEAPIASLRVDSNEQRFRSVLDPVSLFDFAALSRWAPPHALGRRL